ncbi:MAG: hypothetical protein V7732_05975, partial [Halomonas aquamarina]
MIWTAASPTSEEPIWTTLTTGFSDPDSFVTVTINRGRAKLSHLEKRRLQMKILIVEDNAVLAK